MNKKYMIYGGLLAAGYWLGIRETLGDKWPRFLRPTNGTGSRPPAPDRSGEGPG